MSETSHSTQAEPRCVLLADLHHGVAEGTRGLLATLFDAVVMVADEASLRECAARLRPAVAVIDLSLMRGHGSHWLSELHDLCPGIRIVVLSVHDEPAVRQAVLAAGADAFVLKHSIATDLPAAIETLHTSPASTTPAPILAPLLVPGPQT